MATYNPGEKTMPRKVGENRYQIDSFRGEARSYEINLTPGSVACSCPHFVTRLSALENAECKHILACREVEASLPAPGPPPLAEQWQAAAAKAQRLPDASIPILLEKYGTDVVVGGALRVERLRRQQQEANDQMLRGIFA